MVTDRKDSNSLCDLILTGRLRKTALQIFQKSEPDTARRLLYFSFTKQAHTDHFSYAVP